MPMLVEPYWNWLRLPLPAVELTVPEESGAAVNDAGQCPGVKKPLGNETAAQRRGLECESRCADGPS
jgi:hypothetical protein